MGRCESAQARNVAESLTIGSAEEAFNLGPILWVGPRVHNRVRLFDSLLISVGSVQPLFDLWIADPFELRHLPFPQSGVLEVIEQASLDNSNDRDCYALQPDEAKPELASVPRVEGRADSDTY